MKNLKRTVGLGSAAVASLMLAGHVAPGAAAAEKVDGDVQVSNTETVSVLMGADGTVDSQRVYEQLVLSGRGAVDISNPVSTEGLRNLDGFGGWEVVDDAQRVRTDVNGEQKYRSVADYTKDLPVSVDVEYTLNGEKVEPGDVVGERGTLEVRYTVVNLTGKQQDVVYADGEGNEKRATQAVVIPMVGSMTTTLPSSFTEVEPDGANAAGDGKGGTLLSFTMTLFPPIGSDRATFGYTAEIEDGMIPEASLSLLPVNPLENTSFKGGAASYKGGADSGADLTAGAVTIDENLLKLRDGANDLVDGILQLADGANQLNAGLSGGAAPGAAKLAAGAGELNAGAGKLDAGAGELAAGLKTAKGGAPALIKGVQDLAAGAKKVDAGLVALNQGVSAGGEQFKATFGQSVDGAMALAGSGIEKAITDNFVTNVPLHPGLASLTPQQMGTLQAVLGGTRDGVVAGIKADLTGSLAPQLKAGVNGGVDQIVGGVAAGVGDPKSKDTLRNGMAQLIGGLGQLETKGGGLVDGIKQLSDGASQLSAGTGDLKDGTGELSAGAGQLSSGLGEAASGSGQLADGLDQAAESAPALPEGAEQLSEEGTSQLVNVGNGTAMDYGLKYAVIEASSARAAEAQPYGSPESASALTAYKFELASATGEGSANTKRGVAVAVLAAGTLALMGLRRKALAG